MGNICPNYSRTTRLSLLIILCVVLLHVKGGRGECAGGGGRSVASQVEVDGQDDGEEDDGAQDEDQDPVLDDPSEHAGQDT